jgi:integrase/recombinase XerD
MSDLRTALEQYLALRRGLGFTLRRASSGLRRFVAFLEEEGATHITTELSLRWARESEHATPNTWALRFAAVRGFAVWRSATDPRTEIPPKRMLPYRFHRRTPYIYSDEEIEGLVRVASALPSAQGLRALTCSTLFGLLAVTGMRLGEAVALERDDVDFAAGVLAVRRTKFGKSRFIPVHDSTRRALADYAAKRDVIVPRPATKAFFIAERGNRFTPGAARYNFALLSRAIGLRPSADGRRRGKGPRIHDMRHRFTVRALIDWYRAGVDVEREIPKLSTYLGHVDENGTYWYMEAVPELLRLASERGEFGKGVKP